MKALILCAVFAVLSCGKNAADETAAQLVKPEANATVAPVKTGLPFSELDYDRAVAYDYDGGKGGENIIDEKGNLHPGVVKKVVLTPQKTAEITGILSDKDTYGGDGFKCFEPQLGLVFYKGDKVIMHISVCLSCNYLHSSIDIPAESFYEGTDGGGFGFSKGGSGKIAAFAKALGFR